MSFHCRISIWDLSSLFSLKALSGTLCTFPLHKPLFFFKNFRHVTTVELASEVHFYCKNLFRSFICISITGFHWGTLGMLLLQAFFSGLNFGFRFYFYHKRESGIMPSLLFNYSYSYYIYIIYIHMTWMIQDELRTTFFFFPCPEKSL